MQARAAAPSAAPLGQEEGIKPGLPAFPSARLAAFNILSNITSSHSQNMPWLGRTTRGLACEAAHRLPNHVRPFSSSLSHSTPLPATPPVHTCSTMPPAWPSTTTPPPTPPPRILLTACTFARRAAILGKSKTLALWAPPHLVSLLAPYSYTISEDDEKPVACGRRDHRVKHGATLRRGNLCGMAEYRTATPTTLAAASHNSAGHRRFH